MFMHEHVAWLMAKERLEEASRRAEEAQVLGVVRGPHRSVRVRLGATVVRLGRRIMGQGVPDGGCRCEVGAASS
jgi:hypothetical protein